MKFKEVLSFDDVLLVPKKSDIESRQEVDISATLKDHRFRLPIMSSPMDTVTEADMSLEMFSKGGLGVIHRYNSIETQVEIVREIRENLENHSSDSISSISAAVGVSSDFLQRASALYDAGARILCLDVAHGHHLLLERALKSIKDRFADNLTIIAGNVATVEAFIELSHWGADGIRVGIGGGSICSTRIQTGHGVPTFQSIIDCAPACDSSTILIADGGIKTSGDIVKSLAAGADMVMLGSLLAGTDESPGDIITTSEGQTRKIYRGMASVEAQVDWRGEARSLEGISTTIPYKGPVGKVLDDLSQNIKSGLSYSGARSIRELQLYATFVKQTAASQKESKTHILNT